MIVGNEPNHSKEWGGEIEPVEYAQYHVEFYEALKESSGDYFVLNAGFDASAANTRISMDEERFLNEIIKEVPEYFEKIEESKIKSLQTWMIVGLTVANIALTALNISSWSKTGLALSCNSWANIFNKTSVSDDVFKWRISAMNSSSFNSAALVKLPL